MSGDEESFIVLDETPSLLQYSLCSSITEITDPGSYVPSLMLPSNMTTVSEEGTQTSLQPCETNGSLKSHQSNGMTDKTESLENGASKLDPSKSTLAESFLLGAIDCDTMKNTISEYFPNFSTKANSDDMQKLHQLIQERNELRDTLKRTNIAMRYQFSMVNNWHNCVRRLKATHKSETVKLEIENIKLIAENDKLQEKNIHFENMAKMNELTIANISTESVDATQVSDLRLEVDQANATIKRITILNEENMKKHDKLEVELADVQELCKDTIKNNCDLKMQNELLKQSLEKSKQLIGKYRDDINIVQAQCDVFKNDFEMERQARQEIAGEREKLCGEINLLKQRNQLLLEGAMCKLGEDSDLSLTSSAGYSYQAEDNAAAQAFVCPLCNMYFSIYNDLEGHVQSCLERCS